MAFGEIAGHVFGPGAMRQARPLLLAVAIASAVSRMLSYGTIYTTKLLRRGIDVGRAAPWRAFGDLKVSEAMQPLGTPLARARRDPARPCKGPTRRHCPGW